MFAIATQNLVGWILFVSHSAAFQIQPLYNVRGSVLCHSKLTNSPSYSDDWLLGFHNQAQNEKQVTTDSLAVWNSVQQQEQQDILEWQESFQRNGFADFTPPMSAGLNCLMVGGNIDNSRQQPQESNSQETVGITKLPWEEQSEAAITSLRVVPPLGDDDANNNVKGGSLTARASGPDRIGTSLVSSRAAPYIDDPSVSTKIRVNKGKDASVYDCIVDQGLMGAVLNNEETVRELLSEAAIALREHGIYVLVTQILSDETKALLEKHSIEAGLEWNFELDGISNDGSQVSVARRFNTGTMPKIGKLSRFQP
jgi:hypothetical protein